MSNIKTDSQTEEGKAVGLIDAIAAICKELPQYLHVQTTAIKEAIKDLHYIIKENELEGVLSIPLTKDEIENKKLISEVANNIKRNKIKIKL